MQSPYVAAIVIGLIHGLEPGHGWPVAALWARQRPRAALQGVLAGAVLSAFHFISSIAMVVVFLLIARRFNLIEMEALRYVSAAALFALAALSWRRGGHHHHHQPSKRIATLRELAAFAFVLGFVHEEEFAILALCVSGVGCLLLMVVYAAAVTLAIMAFTLAAMRALERFEHRLHELEHKLPHIMAVILALLGVLNLGGWL